MTNTLRDVFTPPETGARRRRRIRTRIVLGTVAAILVTSGLYVSMTMHVPCGSLGSGVYSVGGECVGVTDGSYLFAPEFKAVEQKIAQENASVRAESPSYVTVAVLDLMTPTATSAKATASVRNALEGAYAAQRWINDPIGPTSSSPQIQLVLANHGSTEKQSLPVEEQLKEMTTTDHPLVAVIGMGASTEQTKRRAMSLASRNIPMVGALMTADELDHNHIPGLIRVSPTTLDYATALRRYADTRPDLRSAVLVYDTNSDSGADLFTDSLKKDFEAQLGSLTEGRPPLNFVGASIPNPAGTGRFDIVTPNICSPPTDAVLYAGRKVDLVNFLNSLASRGCRSKPLTVLTAADIGFLLQQPAREQQLREANLEVVYAGTSDYAGWRGGVEGTPSFYETFLRAFQQHGFGFADLADSEAIMMHDALLTAAKAVQLATSDNSPATAARVRGVLLNLNGQFHVEGASGTLSFSSRQVGAGNPIGKPVPVLRFPSPAGDPAGQQVLTPVYVTR